MKTLVIITGAAKGIGSAIFNHFIDSIDNDASFLLFDKDLISTHHDSVKCVTVDFARLPNHTSYVSVLEENLPSRKELEEFDELISVYNHGTLEFGSVEHEAEHDLRNKFEINVFSVWSLLAAVNKLIPESVIANQKFVNITSKMADTPKAHWSGHCCTRASREMLFRCFALENPNFRVVNYEPGIVNTDMLKEAASNESTGFKDIYEKGLYVTPNETAAKLFDILKMNQFVSGSRVAFTKKTEGPLVFYSQ